MKFFTRFLPLMIVVILLIGCEKNESKRKIRLSNQEVAFQSDQSLTTTLYLDRQERLSVAVFFFKNLSGDPDLQWLQKGLTEMLIRALSQSHSLSVLSTNHLLEILERSGYLKTVKNFDKKIAAMVAKEANVEAVLMGNIKKIGNDLRIIVKIMDPIQGIVLKEEVVEGQGIESIFNMVDELTRQIKSDLALSFEKGEQIPKIADITTNSLEAWQSYVTATERAEQFMTNEAIPYFEEAISYDSTFVSAYLDLTQAYLKTGENEKAYQLVQKLSRMKNKATPQENYRINLFEAQFNNDAKKYVSSIKEWLQEYPKDRDAQLTLAQLYDNWNNTDLAIAHYRKAIEIDPKYKAAYNKLAYVYANSGNFSKAISTIKKYLDLAPEEANPYDSFGDILFLSGDFKKAKKYYEKALSLNKNFLHSIRALGLINLYTGKYDKALKYFNNYLDIATDRIQRSDIYSLLALTYLRTGDIKNTIKYYRKSQDENDFNFVAIDMINRLYLEKGDSVSANKELEASYARFKKKMDNDALKAPALSYLVWLSIAWNINQNESIEIIKQQMEQYQHATSGNVDEINLTQLKFLLTLLYQRQNQLSKIDGLWSKGDIFPQDFWNILKEVKSHSYSDDWRSFGMLNATFYNYPAKGYNFYRSFLKFAIENEVQTIEMMMRLLLSDLYLHAQKKDRAREQIKFVGVPFEDQWLVIGPFEYNDGFRKKYPPEKGINLNKIYRSNSKKITWQHACDQINDGFINFSEIFSEYKWGVGYGLIFINSPDEKSVQLRFGADDQSKIWLNDKEIWRLHKGGPAFFDNYKINIKLKKGMNKILVKVCNTVSDWGFFFRITDENGVGIPDIQYIPADNVFDEKMIAEAQ